MPTTLDVFAKYGLSIHPKTLLCNGSYESNQYSFDCKLGTLLDLLRRGETMEGIIDWYIKTWNTNTDDRIHAARMTIDNYLNNFLCIATRKSCNVNSVYTMFPKPSNGSWHDEAKRFDSIFGTLLKSKPVPALLDDFIALSLIDKVITCLDWVDLGLPSGIKWAKCNIGALESTDYGSYFAWGETETKTNFEFKSYKFAQQLKEGGYIIRKYSDGSSLSLDDDAACENCGIEWRMPSKADFMELIDYCIWKPIFNSTVNGYQIVGPNKSSIFLPAAGSWGTELTGVNAVCDYWTRSIDAEGVAPWRLHADDKCLHPELNQCLRHFGLTIRPVKK